MGNSEQAVSTGENVMQPDDLNSLKDDMIAFIEGHGMKRFHSHMHEEVNSVLWDPEDNPECWKDFVELAKASGVAFLTMHDFVLEREDLDYLTKRLNAGQYTGPEDLEEARWLKSYVGHMGFIQLGYPYQGVLFRYEVSLEWYERYQRLCDFAEECGAIMFDEFGQDDEH
jgi:hypothetical protein